MTPRFLDFISAHPASLGLAADISPSHLSLRPLAEFRAASGGLTILRYRQSYRGFPVFGLDGVVRLIANSRGVIGMRGSLIDARIEFKFAAEQQPQQTAELVIRQEVALRTGLAAGLLWLSDVRLVAIPRARAIGWHARVAQGTRHVATVVLAADPSTSASPQVLHYSRDSAGGLKDELGVTILAEDMDSDVISKPVDAESMTVLRDQSPLLGSFAEGVPILGTERVVAYDAGGILDPQMQDVLSPVSDADGVFDGPVGTTAFSAQTAYYAVQNMYQWTHRLMAGQWDSLLGEASTIPPEIFAPRVLIYNSVEFDGCEDTAACVSRAAVKGPALAVPDEFEQPLQGPVFEDLAVITLEKVEGLGANVIAHEFGHVVDLFADAGFIDTGSPCQGDLCGAPSCKLDTTDESAPLTETFAQLAALWYMRALYMSGAPADSCAVPKAVSRGDDRRPHHDACRPGGEPFSVFLTSEDPECPQESLCDHVFTASSATGICSDSPGYRTDSFFQAFWELLHAQTCATEAPFTCSSLPALEGEVPGDMVGGALLHALRVNTATYHGFADDAATFIACNHGPAAYQQFNEVLCHHKIRACDAPVPVDCELCGNDIQEGDEACDGSDFAGATCQSQGFAGGVLLCDKNCLLDESACSVASPTTGGEEDVPTTGFPASTSSAQDGDSSGVTSGGQGDDTGLDGVEEGCGCRPAAPGAGSVGLGVLMLGLFRRRRGRGALGGVVFALLMITGCVGGGASDAGDASTTTGEASSSDGEATAGSSTGELVARMAGEFHWEGDKVGYVNPPSTPDSETLYFLMNLGITLDGKVSARHQVCAGEGIVQEFESQAEDGILAVVPGPLAPDGSFKWGADSVASVQIAPGEHCDEIVVTIAYPESSGKVATVARFLAGSVCAEGSECDFELVWCDGQAPGPCM